MSLAEQKGALYWKANGLLVRGWISALTGKASDAIQMLTSGLAAYRSTGSTNWVPLHLSYLAKAHSELDQFDEAWSCIGEAVRTVRNDQGKVVRGRGQSHGRGNRAEVAGAGCRES